MANRHGLSLIAALFCFFFISFSLMATLVLASASASVSWSPSSLSSSSSSSLVNYKAASSSSSSSSPSAGSTISSSSRSSSSSSALCDAPAVFAFGDSLTDTGNVVRIFHPMLKQPLSLPYGSSFFQRPAHRFSDGRILIDHLVSTLGLPFLSPFLKFVGTDFSTGVNYAMGSATALNVSYSTALGAPPMVPCTLDVQLQWHDSVLELINAGLDGLVTKLPNASSIEDAIYFLEFGGNDIVNYIQVSMTYEEIMSILPTILDKIKGAIEHLYEHGARNFVISGIGTMGCSPNTKYFLSGSTLDSQGCIAWVNDICRNYTNSLGSLASFMQDTLPNASFVFLDLYAAFEDILANPGDYGLKDTMNACCGAPDELPGVVNGFHALVMCGPDARICQDPDAFLSWDGIHFTDHTVHQILQRGFLQGRFITPSTALSSCNKLKLKQPPSILPTTTI